MTYYEDNLEMEEASSGDFTITATGTVYSKDYAVGKFAMSELLITNKYVYSNKSGAIITPTLQYYCNVTANWYDHAASFSASDPAGATTQYTALDIATAFGNRIRLKVVASGTFGGSEQVVVTAAFIAKSR